jgi:hypothetical protein
MCALPGSSLPSMPNNGAGWKRGPSAMRPRVPPIRSPRDVRGGPSSHVGRCPKDARGRGRFVSSLSKWVYFEWLRRESREDVSAASGFLSSLRGPNFCPCLGQALLPPSGGAPRVRRGAKPSCMRELPAHVRSLQPLHRAQREAYNRVHILRFCLNVRHPREPFVFVTVRTPCPQVIPSVRG